jgi:hypothetical protein
MSADSLGRIVEMWTGQNSYHGVGMVVGYQEQPTFLIRTPDGGHISWAAHLCREPGLSKEAGDELMPQKAPQASKSHKGNDE